MSKSARRCGAKHISKSKHREHTRSAPLLEVAMSKEGTPLWREAHVEVKTYKTPQLRSTFRSCNVEKVHAVVAQSTLRSQNVQNTHYVRTTFGSYDVEKVHTVVARSTFRSQHVKITRGSDCTFGRSDVLSRGRRRGLWTLSKVSKMWGFCTISKNDGRHGTFEEDLQRCIFRGRRNTRDIHVYQMLGGPGGDFLRGFAFGASDLQVCWDDFAWQVQHFVWPGSTFSWQAQ